MAFLHLVNISFNLPFPGILSGIVIIPGTAGGIFLGSYLVKRVDVRKSCKMAAKFCFIFQFLGTWTVLTFLIPGCKMPLLAGISHPYNNRYIKKEKVNDSANRELTKQDRDGDEDFIEPFHSQK